MMAVHPWWARFVGIVWLVAAAVLVATGVVVVVDRHEWLRWEFVVGVACLLVGLRSWRRAVVVDAHGIEDRVGRRRRRLLWSTLDRVAVGAHGRRGGPVTVWRTGAEQPVVLRSSWGTSRSQRLQLAAALRRLAGAHGVEITSDVGEAPGSSAWTARGHVDA